MKDYFCEHCFEDKNIKQYIRDYGDKIEKKLDCSFCTFETEIDEWHTDECIDEYIQKCMETHEKELTTQEFEDREIELDEQCIKECKEKYQIICKDKFIKPTFVIEEEKLIQKLKKVVLNLYEHENSHGFYGSANPTYWTDGVDDPCAIAPLNEFCEVYENIFGDESSKIEDLLEKSSDDFGEFHPCPWLYRCFDDREDELEAWEEFREHTKHKARYFEHQEDKENKLSVIKTLEDFKPFFEKMTTYSDKEIYRVRPIYTEKDKKDIRKNPSVELGKIPKYKLEYTRNNRFSPVGISYGYFAFDKETALIESRVKVNDEVGIGEFKLDKSLKLIDFTNDNLSKYLNPFYADFNINLYCNSFFVQSFIKDISKPISDNDSLLEYVPTQIMAEYIWSIGYSGFIFDSSQKKGGENIVIFGDNPQFNNFKIAKVTNIKYDLEEVI